MSAPFTPPIDERDEDGAQRLMIQKLYLRDAAAEGLELLRRSRADAELIEAIERHLVICEDALMLAIKHYNRCMHLAREAQS